MRKIFSFRIGSSLVTIKVRDKDLALDLLLAAGNLIDFLALLENKVERKIPQIKAVDIRVEGDLGVTLRVYAPEKHLGMITHLATIYRLLNQIHNSNLGSQTGPDPFYANEEREIDMKLQVLSLTRMDVHSLKKSLITIKDEDEEKE